MKRREGCLYNRAPGPTAFRSTARFDRGANAMDCTATIRWSSLELELLSKYGELPSGCRPSASSARPPPPPQLSPVPSASADTAAVSSPRRIQLSSSIASDPQKTWGELGKRWGINHRWLLLAACVIYDPRHHHHRQHHAHKHTGTCTISDT